MYRMKLSAFRSIAPRIALLAALAALAGFTACRTLYDTPGDFKESRKRIDQGQGAIILTDLFGGTPSNLAISLLDTGRVEVIAGINLPMLIRLAGARKSMNVVDAVNAAQTAGRNYITVASEFLGQDLASARKAC